MGKIGDIWVRLGLKKEGYTQGINEAKKETQGFGASLGKMKAGALAVWAAIGTAVVAFGKQMISATNRIGDAWNHTTVQMKAGWDVFLQSLSNWNWDNFIGRIRESAAAAKELQNALDFEFEATNSINLQKAMYSEELAQLQIDMRNQTKSYEERAAAARKYLSIVEPIYQQEIDLRKRLMDANISKWFAGSGIEDNESNRAAFGQFVIDYGKNQDLIDAVTNYNSDKVSKDVWEAARDYIYQYAEETGNYAVAAMARVYETMRGDKDTIPVVEAITEYYNALAAFNQETRRVQSSLNTALAGMEGGDSVTGQEALIPEGSLAYLEEQLKKARQDAAAAVGEAAQVQAQATVRELEEQIDGMKLWIDTQVSLARGTYVEDFLGDIEIPAEDMSFNDKIDLKPVDIDVPELSSGMEEYTRNINAATSAIGMLGGAMSNITGLVDSGAASWVSYGTNVIQAIAQAIPAIASLTAAKGAEATANAASAAAGAGSAVASIPYVGPIMAVAAIASVIAALANVPKFAKGGIVGGSSYYGDRILARLNSGELVLNRSQQAGLLGALDRPVQRVEITGRLTASGRDLQYVFDDYQRYRRQ